MSMAQAAQRKFQVTGPFVLACLIGFFAVIFAVNGVMMYAARATFGGVETSSSYKAGLQFNHELESAREQQSLGWSVGGSLQRMPDGTATLVVNAVDRSGAAVTGLTAKARLEHPANAQFDHAISLEAAGAGTYRGVTVAAAGQWELFIDLYRGEERMFRSQSRVVLK